MLHLVLTIFTLSAGAASFSLICTSNIFQYDTVVVQSFNFIDIQMSLCKGQLIKRVREKKPLLEQPQAFGVSDELAVSAFRNCTRNDDCSLQADSIVCEQSI